MIWEGIAAIGAISMLIIHMTVHIGHLRLLGETGASRFLVVSAIVANAGAIALSTYHVAQSAPYLLLWIGGFFLLALAIELVLHHFADRSVKSRVDGEVSTS